MYFQKAAWHCTCHNLQIYMLSITTAVFLTQVVNFNAGSFAGGGCQTSPDCKAGPAAPLDAGQSPPPPLPLTLVSGLLSLGTQ